MKTYNNINHGTLKFERPYSLGGERMTTITRGNLALFTWILSLGLVIGFVYWELTNGLSLEQWVMMNVATVIFVASFIFYFQEKRSH